MDKTQLLDLADRCEKVKNNSPMLSEEICAALEMGWSWDRDYTSSVTLAATIIPTAPFPDIRPGQWWWSVDSLGCNAHVAYENHDSGIPEYSGKAATPELALCAAALRALADTIQ